MEAIIGIRWKQFSKKELIFARGQLIFWIVETIFFSIFQRILPVICFFCLVETMFQEYPSFRLVETGFRANNGFRNKEEKLQIKEYCLHETKILIPPAEMKDSLKKVSFHYAKNLLSLAGIHM